MQLHAVTISPDAAALSALDPLVALAFLGLDPAGAAVFAGAITAEVAEEFATEHGALWAPVRREGPRMSPSDAALLAVAQVRVSAQQCALPHHQLPGHCYNNALGVRD